MKNPSVQILESTPSNIARAAMLLRDGEVVAFPTETVYGLGAHALDETAVVRIYAAKGRPAYNPLIVHLASIAGAQGVVSRWPDAAERLARQFWPGPLTLVLPKASNVPHGVTAGLETVGVRVPDHPVAQALLQAAAIPLAAPSANRFMGLSPTTAAHVAHSLGDKIAWILDGGPTQIGIESTVLDLSRDRPILLRPGAISRAQIEAILGPIQIAAEISGEQSRPAPGMLDRHYAPRTPAFRFENRGQIGDFLSRNRDADSLSIGALSLSTSVGNDVDAELILPADAVLYARQLYDALHQLDRAACELLLIEMPPDEEEWRGVRDRIMRATQSLSRYK